MARLTLSVDTTRAREIVGEIIALVGNGTGLPDHLIERIGRICRPREPADVVAVDNLGGGEFRADAGPELLSILATLRAIRGAGAAP